MLTAAPLESARFGLHAFRATLQEVDASELFEELSVAGADLAILRVPSRQAHAIRELDRYGLSPIHADTLVSYECDLHAHEPAPPAPDGFSIELARDSDRGAIAELVTQVFTDYPTHYRANPLLGADAILEGYREWALSHIEGEGLVAWVARKDGKVASIACSAFDATTGICQGVLHGVLSEFARCGIYTALIRHTQQYFRKLGFENLKIQTQAWNMPVQRVWVREGFTLSEVYETFHVNALLDPARAVRHHLACTPGLPREIAACLQATVAPAGSQQADASIHGFRFTLFRELRDGAPCTLHARACRQTGGTQIAGTLRDTAERICATARLICWPRA